MAGTTRAEERRSVFARIARYDVPPEELEETINAFREAGASLQELEGMIGGYLLVDPEEGTTISLTLWETQRLLEASQTRAASLRQRAVQAAGGSVQSVANYEVALEFGGHTRVLTEDEA